MPELKERIERIRQGYVPDGYKQTRKGIIPNDWVVRQIRDFAVISSGSTPNRANPAYWNGDIPWVTTGELESGYVAKTSENISKKALSETSLRVYPVGTLLMAMYGQGKTRGTVAKLDIEATVNQACAAISLSAGDADFVFYALQNAYNDIRKLSNTGNQENLNADIIKTFALFFPPILEQKKIAEILTTQDKVIELKEKLLAEKQRQKKYLMQQLLTGKKRLGGFKETWRSCRLSEILNEGSKDRVDDISRHRKITVKLNFKGLEYAVPTREMADTRPFYVRKLGEIIIGKQNYFNGSIALVTEEFDGCICSNAIMSFSVHDANANYVVAYISQMDFLKKHAMLANGTGQKELSEKDFLNFTIMLPNIKEQAAIADILMTAGKEIDLLRQDIEQEKQKKKALMQLLLTGIVRVNV